MTALKRNSWSCTCTISLLYALLHLSLFVYQVDSLQLRKLAQAASSQLRSNNNTLEGATYIGVGELQGPEDIAYDKKSGIIYTGCGDGSIKKVYIRRSNTTRVVESFVNTGGRPLGVALGHDNELIVADANKGLLNVSKDGVVKLLTDEAEGSRFKLTDGVDVANNRIIYFTDASDKYGLPLALLDISIGKPNGRLMSYDPVTNKTTVLLRDLYFPNGVTVSPDQNLVIFCETSKPRCRKYHIRGPKMGLTENFIDNLPGFPDNIRYDGEGHYWIGIYGETLIGGRGGILATDLEGIAIAYYSDSTLSLTGGNRIGNDLYLCSGSYPYIIKIDLTRP